MVYYVLPEWERFSAYKGGALAHITEAIMRFDSSSVVVCSGADQSANLDPARILTIPVLARYARLKGRFFLPRWIYTRFLRVAYRPLLARLRRDDIVWCLSQPFVACALEPLIRQAGAHLVYHAQSSVSLYPRKDQLQTFEADGYVFVSEAMRAEALSVMPTLKNTCSIPNGADPEVFYPADKGAGARETPVVLFIGRLHPEKGVHVLLEAMRILETRKVSVRCRVVGSAFSGGSKPTKYVKHLLSTKPESVEFAPFQSYDSIAREYRMADIFCCPSLFQEPFGSVNVEGMATALPVVASRVGGIPEIASQGGIVLVEPGSAEQLADELQALVEAPDRRALLGHEGLRSFRKRFSWDVVVPQYNAVTVAIRDGARKAEGVSV